MEKQLIKYIVITLFSFMFFLRAIFGIGDHVGPGSNGVGYLIVGFAFVSTLLLLIFIELKTQIEK